MESKKFNLKGIHCASCGSIIESTLKKVEGVHHAEVNVGTETLKISYDDSKLNDKTISSHIEPLGYSLIMSTAEEMNMSENEHAAHLGLNQSKKEKLIELESMKKQLMTVIPLATFSFFVMIWEILAKFKLILSIPDVVNVFFHHLFPVMATYTLFVAGKPYLLGLYRFLRYRKANMDSLIGLGTVVAFMYSFIISAFETTLSKYINVEAHYYDVTIVVIAFITLGKYLETKAKIKTGDAIEKLLNLQAKTALIVRDGKEVEISIDQVVHGDLIIVKPGSAIPVDGLVTQGSSFIDESMITGEPMPVEKNINDKVVAGTINTTGSFIFKATKVGGETLLAHIIKMVEEAQSSRAPIQVLADKISAIFVPTVLILSFITLGVWLIFGSSVLGFSQALSFGLTSFVGILVIACPCALGLATPTAIIVGVGKGAKEGILIKDAATLEKLHKIDYLVVDKTGTITKGKPELVSFENFSKLSDEKIISILATLENKSEHPIAMAILNYAKTKKIEVGQLSDFEVIKGKGVKAKIDNSEYYLGNIKLISELNLTLDLKNIEVETLKGKTPVILANAQEVLAVAMVADALKAEAMVAVKDLHKLGVKIVMLTGDNKNTANFIAQEVGIDEVVAEALPEDKLNKIKALQSKGCVVAMAGDGINDAPALAIADIGIAMGTGTDVAIEAAGITLLNGDISKIVKAVNLSKITMTGIKQNLFWAFFYNIIGIPLAAGLFYPIFGWLLSPVFAGLAMAFSSVSVVTNSLRLKFKKI